MCYIPTMRQFYHNLLQPTTRQFFQKLLQPNIETVLPPFATAQQWDSIVTICYSPTVIQFYSLTMRQFAIIFYCPTMRQFCQHVIQPNNETVLSQFATAYSPKWDSFCMICCSLIMRQFFHHLLQRNNATVLPCNTLQALSRRLI